jgi:endonuclease III
VPGTVSKKNVRIAEILERLNAHYPIVKTQLEHSSAFQLLVATILSAQCTDRQVNAATPRLFKELKNPWDFAGVPLEKLEELIRSTGFYKNKARHLQNCARNIVDRFAGEVPREIEDLVTLPGVGRKTANVIRGAVFGIPSIVVDTHVIRISRRLDLSRSTSPEKIESDLMKIIPMNKWIDFSLWLIYFGREICKARKPECFTCFLNDLCHSPDKRQDIKEMTA